MRVDPHDALSLHPTRKRERERERKTTVHLDADISGDTGDAKPGPSLSPRRGWPDSNKEET
jgi:hypothetical protein